MILSAQSIRARVLGVRGGRDPWHRKDAVPDVMRLRIDPFSERAVVHGMSYGLSACGYDIRVKDAVEVPAGDFVLAVSVEYFAFPRDLRGVLADKSTWARRGIAVQNTRFEPGWRGYPTIEISNHGRASVVIPAGAPIAQMEFGLLDASTEQAYAGKYQDQPQRPVAAIEEK